mgnify:CR=1 FL=1
MTHWILGIFVATASLCAAADKLNVLFLISDDLGAQALGCYGNKDVQTPNIDALAKRGMRFTNAYCQFPVCGPSRAALMSGLYPQQNGVVGNSSSDKLTSRLGKRPTVAEYFKAQGYHSARVSKIYHMRVPGDITAGVDGPDHAASWTEKFNCQGPEWYTEGPKEHLSNERLNFDKDKHYGLGFGTAFYVVRGEGDGSEQADHQAAAKASELLETQRRNPFVLAVGFVRPHVPLVAPEKFYEPYPPQKMTLPEAVANDWDDIPKAGLSKTSGMKGDAAKQKKTLAAYYASVSYMDAQVGKVLEALEENGLRDNTIVVFTADHGYHLGEHDFWQKMSLHEESARVPIIIAGPGIDPGESASLVEAIDLYPTWCELAGLPVPDHCVGKSLIPVLKDPTAEVRDMAYCFKGSGHLIRTKRWAYMQYRTDAEELYDMGQDPKQFTNLAMTRPEVVKEMRERLANKLATMK